MEREEAKRRSQLCMEQIEMQCYDADVVMEGLVKAERAASREPQPSPCPETQDFPATQVISPPQTPEKNVPQFEAQEQALCPDPLPKATTPVMCTLPDRDLPRPPEPDEAPCPEPLPQATELDETPFPEPVRCPCPDPAKTPFPDPLAKATKPVRCPSLDPAEDAQVVLCWRTVLRSHQAALPSL